MRSGPKVDLETAVSVSELGIVIGGARLLDSVSFDCRPGEWTLLHGPTGAGKSTLLRAINGLRPPSEGGVWVLGSRIPGRSGAEARRVWRQTGTVLQEVALFETKSALENVMLTLCTIGFDRSSARERATEWLERLNLGHKLAEYPSRLSGGERQRVALARAFAISPRLLILDEPTSALDRATAHIVLTAVREFAWQGTTIVMSSHRLDEIVELCDQQIGLRNGCVVTIDRRPGVEKRIAAIPVFSGDGHHRDFPMVGDTAIPLEQAEADPFTSV